MSDDGNLPYVDSVNAMSQEPEEGIYQETEQVGAAQPSRSGPQPSTQINCQVGAPENCSRPAVDSLHGIALDPWVRWSKDSGLPVPSTDDRGSVASCLRCRETAESGMGTDVWFRERASRGKPLPVVPSCWSSPARVLTAGQPHVAATTSLSNVRIATGLGRTLDDSNRQNQRECPPAPSRKLRTLTDHFVTNPRDCIKRLLNTNQLMMLDDEQNLPVYDATECIRSQEVNGGALALLLRSSVPEK